MIRKQNRLIAAAVACGVLLLTSRQLEASPTVVLGRSVPAGQRISIDQIEHARLDGLLRRYVDQNGNVDYRGWKDNDGDVRSLDAYLRTLSAADPRRPASRQARLAFWINAYNAVTIRGILREYPTTSIRNHTARLFGYNIWKDLQLSVGGNAYSLEQIEHKVLRPMNEPRIHFAIVCASRSCPRLLGEAYTSSTVDDQLAENAIDFFEEPSNFRYVPGENRVYLSSILKWFAEDFGSDRGAQLRYIARFLPTEAARRTVLRNDVRLSYVAYDWGLNDQATARPVRR